MTLYDILFGSLPPVIKMGESSQCGRVPEGRGGSVGGGRVGGSGGGVRGGVEVGTNPNFRYESTHSGKQRYLEGTSTSGVIFVKHKNGHFKCFF